MFLDFDLRARVYLILRVAVLRKLIDIIGLIYYGLASMRQAKLIINCEVNFGYVSNNYLLFIVLK